MELSLKDFEDLNLYSNQNMQRVVSSLTNKSSNAVLVSMYEDSVVLLDHKEGQFYVADYKFDKEKMTLKLENFEPVELRKEAEDFRESVYEYFDSEEADVNTLTESYRDDVLEQEKFINELINDAMSTKDFSEAVDYDAIGEAIKEVDLESTKERFFTKYKNRLETHPLTEIKHFNWKDAVLVSLVETESQKLVNKSAVEKANDLWKKSDFKQKFNETCRVFMEDVEEGTERFKAIFEEYPQIFFLGDADRKALFGKTILSSKELRDNMDDILKGIDLLFEKFDISDIKEEYLAEQDPEAAPAEAPEGKEETPAEETPAQELSPEEIKKVVDDLKKVSGKVEDEGAKEKIDAIIEKLSKGIEEGTRPDLVKEAVSILLL